VALARTLSAGGEEAPWTSKTSDCSTSVKKKRKKERWWETRGMILSPTEKGGEKKALNSASAEHALASVAVGKTNGPTGGHKPSRTTIGHQPPIR